MLTGSFCTLKNSLIQGDQMITTLLINADHEIFQGHFPGMPVVPGVCMVEMIKEILEEVVGKKTNLKKAGNIKFLHVLDPNIYPEISAEVKVKELVSGWNISAKLFKDELVFFKMDAGFEPA